MSLSGHITGCVIGLFAPCKTCHSDKDPLWQHSSGDSRFGRRLDRKMQPWEVCACACIRPVRFAAWYRMLCERKIYFAACADLMCVCVSILVCWPPAPSAVHLPTAKSADLIGCHGVAGMTHAASWCDATLLLTPVELHQFMSHLPTNKLFTKSLSYLQ